MNQFTVHSPEAGFSGESCGVAFKNGAATVSDSSKEGRAAIEYFRRRGYTLTPVAGEEAEEQGSTPGEPFDPGTHSVAEVLAYLDTADDAERERVIDTERAGKNRKTITDKEAAA